MTNKGGATSDRYHDLMALAQTMFESFDLIGNIDIGDFIQRVNNFCFMGDYTLRHMLSVDK